MNTTAGADLSAALSQRSTLSAGLIAQRTFYLEGLTPDYYSIGSNVRWTQRAFQHLSFYVGYRREQTFYGELKSQSMQGLDFGVDYGDQLKLSRHTTLSLAVGVGSAPRFDGTTHYHFLGNATLTHTMGRTWTSSVGYSRTLEFETQFLAPVLRDTANAMLAGQLNSRLSFTASGSYSKGDLGLETDRRY